MAEMRRVEFWSQRYAVRFAGVEWDLRTRSGILQAADLVSFVDDASPNAEAMLERGVYRALVDGSCRYRLGTEDDGRTTWRDGGEDVVLSFCSEENPRLEFRWMKVGTIRVFSSCLPAHAPVLLLLGLTKMIKGGVPRPTPMFMGGLG